MPTRELQDATLMEKPGNIQVSQEAWERYQNRSNMLLVLNANDCID